MTIRFSPHRQGFAHTLEAEDVALLRGTPIYLDDLELDTRIVVRRNRSATRALWIRRDAIAKPFAEFHHWEYIVSETAYKKLNGLLAIAAEQFSSAPKNTGEETGESLTFWHDNARFTAELHTGPPEMIRECSQSQIDAFDAVRTHLFEIVPAQASIDTDTTN